MQPGSAAKGDSRRRQLMAEGCLNQAIVHEIEEEARARIPNSGRRRKGSHIIFYIALFSLLFSARRPKPREQPRK